MAGNAYFKIDQGTTSLQISEYASLSQSKLDIPPTADVVADDKTQGVI